ncbi:MAG: adenylate/guanylate cyclase domain-containing protein [Armatimonadota bacterium]
MRALPPLLPQTKSGLSPWLRRLRWLGPLLLLVGALAWRPALALSVLAIVLGGGGLLYWVTAVGWGMFHPRVVLRGRDGALRWSFGLSLLGGLFITGGLEALLALRPDYPLFPSALIPLLVLLAVPLGFLLLLPLSFSGAAVGAFASRRSPEVETAAQAGPTCWWGAALLLLAFANLASRIPGVALRPLPALFLLGTPLLAALLSRAALCPSLRPERLTRGVVRLLSRRLVWRPSVRGRPLKLDFRGAALGLCAALLVLAARPWVQPLQGTVLITLMNFRNALAVWNQRADAELRFVETGSPARIVLLELDAPLRREAVQTGSEAEVQARLIRKLAAWKPLRVVLPQPLLPGDRPSDWYSVPGEPQPDAADAERNAKQIGVLTGAMREAGNVVFARPRLPSMVLEGLPAQEIPQETLAAARALAAAAAAVGDTDLPTAGTARLPVLPTAWTENPPLPLLMAAAAKGEVLRPGELRDDEVSILGRTVVPVEDRQLLIDFVSGGGGGDFPRFTYSSILRGDSFYTTEAAAAERAPAGRWIRPAEYFRDKIVVLDSLARRPRETPLGLLPASEVAAYAAQDLLAPAPLAPTAPLELVLIVLFFGVLTGYVCAGRGPLDAGWRVMFAIVVIVGASVVLYLEREWLDPVLPIVTVALAGFVVTQLTFAMESDERERNRQVLSRFLPPQLVERLIDDPDARLKLGGARQQVCVLFADVRNFTRFAELASPEAVVETTNAYLTAMTGALFEHGGVLDKFTGDGLMAWFPVSDRDHDVRQAVRAAIAMARAATEVGRGMLAQGRPPLQIGIGMHYGEAIVGLVGSPNRPDFTALGHTVVVSHRLQSLAAGGEVVVSQDVASVMGEDFHAEAGEPVQVKGLSAPVRPYRLRLQLDLEPAGLDEWAVPEPAPAASSESG